MFKRWRRRGTWAALITCGHGWRLHCPPCTYGIFIPYAFTDNLPLMCEKEHFVREFLVGCSSWVIEIAYSPITYIARNTQCHNYSWKRTVDVVKNFIKTLHLCRMDTIGRGESGDKAIKPLQGCHCPRELPPSPLHKQHLHAQMWHHTKVSTSSMFTLAWDLLNHYKLAPANWTTQE